MYLILMIDQLPCDILTTICQKYLPVDKIYDLRLVSRGFHRYIMYDLVLDFSKLHNRILMRSISRNYASKINWMIKHKLNLKNIDMYLICMACDDHMACYFFKKYNIKLSTRILNMCTARPILYIRLETLMIEQIKNGRKSKYLNKNI